MVKFSTTKERQRTLKKELSDRLLGPVGYPGRIALEGAPAADFLQSLSGAESISDIVGWALKVTGQDGWKTRVPGWSVGMLAACNLEPMHLGLQDPVSVGQMAPNQGMGTYWRIISVRTGYVPTCPNLGRQWIASPLVLFI